MLGFEQMLFSEQTRQLPGQLPAFNSLPAPLLVGSTNHVVGFR